MKSLFTLALIALSTFAVSAKAMTLADYDSSRSYIVSWPTVIFSNLSVPVKNVCVEGQTLKTINPAQYCSQPAVVEVCTRNAKGSSEECRSVVKGEKVSDAPGTRLVWGCAAYASQQFTTSMNYPASVCTKWEQVDNGGHNKSNICVAFGTETKTYALNYDVSVTANSNNHSGRVEVAVLPFSIPACK